MIVLQKAEHARLCALSTHRYISQSMARQLFYFNRVARTRVYGRVGAVVMVVVVCVCADQRVTWPLDHGVLMYLCV